MLNYQRVYIYIQTTSPSHFSGDSNHMVIPWGKKVLGNHQVIDGDTIILFFSGQEKW